MLPDTVSTDLRAWHAAHIAAQALYDAPRADAVRAGVRRRWRAVRPRVRLGRTPDDRTHRPKPEA